MKRMNNKGFAISTVIYGLSIMSILIVSILMGTMSSTRSNSRKLSKTIEEELNRYSKTDTSFKASTASTPEAQEYIVPTGQSGWYRIELWGAQGGNNGGLGAYTSGIIKLNEGDILYFYVGKKGGGSASGQSTDVRLMNGKYSESVRSYETRIMVAAGGGSGVGASGGTLYGYNSAMEPLGGQIRVNASTGYEGDYNLISGKLAGYPSNYAPSALSQTSNGAPRPHATSSTGGDGYVPSSQAAICGVSFISGYAGSIAYVKGSFTTNNPTYSYHEYIYDDSGNGIFATEGKKHYFIEGRMFPGVNSGDGRARIERIVDETDTVKAFPRKNLKLNNVQIIRDCLATSNSNITWTNLQAMSNGTNVASGKSLVATSSPPSGYTCKEVNLGAQYNLDEIAVWHKSGEDYRNHTMYVYHHNGSQMVWDTIKAPGNGTELSETESVTGIRISAYQPDYTVELPDSGNYYIIPVLAENKCFTAHETSESDNDPINITYINGYKRQNWNIELIDQKLRKPGVREYKISELAHYKSLSIYLDENKVGNLIRANTDFNRERRNEIEIWKVTPVGNGTYTISTVVPAFSSSVPSGYIISQTNPSVANYNKIIIGRNNTITGRYKLVALDY